MPIALPRSAAGKALVMIESVAGIMNAAPTPWAIRLTTSVASEGAKPAVAEESAKTIDAEEERAAAAEDVAEPAAGREQDGEGEGVAVDRPLERRDRGVELALDRGQGHVHDRVVEHDHEQGEAHRRERPPLGVVLGDEAFAVAGHL